MSQQSKSSADGLTLADYLRVVWRWKWMILIAALASTVAAYVYSSLQEPQYKATASIVYVEPVDPSDPLESSSYYSNTRDLAVQNVLNQAESPKITARVEEDLRDTVTSWYAISTSLREAGTESADAVGGVVDVTATSGDPDDAEAVANAYAQAIVDWRKDQQQERIGIAIGAVQAQLKKFNTQESRLTTDYVMLKQQLQNLELLKTTATGDFEILAQASAPAGPFSPQPLRSAGFGLGVGLLIGIGLAFLFNQLTHRVRTMYEVGDVIGLPVVGTVPKVDRRVLREDPLFTLSQPSGRAAESLRLLRVNLEYLNVSNARSLMVTSSVSGEGKSITVCNLAIAMAMAGKRVAIVDADLRRPRIHQYLGVPNSAGLSSVATGNVALADALVPLDLPPTTRMGVRESTRNSGQRVRTNPRAAVVPLDAPSTDSAGEPGGTDERQVIVLTAGPYVPNPGEVVASERFGSVVHDLATDGMDFILIDAPPLLEVGDAAAIAAHVDSLVVVVDLSRARHETLVETRHALGPLPCKKLGAILVQAKSGGSGYGYYD